MGYYEGACKRIMMCGVKASCLVVLAWSQPDPKNLSDVATVTEGDGSCEGSIE